MIYASAEIGTGAISGLLDVGAFRFDVNVGLIGMKCAGNGVYVNGRLSHFNFDVARGGYVGVFFGYSLLG